VKEMAEKWGKVILKYQMDSWRTLEKYFNCFYGTQCEADCLECPIYFSNAVNSITASFM
jgi:hypothetical protein